MTCNRAWEIPFTDMTLLEDHPTFTLWHDASCACLYATWLGKHSESQVLFHYNLIHQYLRQTGSSKLLNDSSQDEDGWSEVTRWLVEEGFTRLAEDGLLVVAWVLPRHPAALYDTAWVLAHLRQPLVDTFIDAQTAYDWLHRWPTASFSGSARKLPLTAVTFLVLPPAQQIELVKQQGRALPPRFEQDYYIMPYEISNILQVEIYYHLHSGVFYQIRVQIMD